MMNVSQAYKDNIDADNRNITVKIEMYFDGYSNPPETFTKDQIGSFKLLEEAYSDSQSPLGTVSSNEIEIVIENINGRFNSKNQDSDLYNKLKSGIKIIPYFGLILESGTEWLQLGEFYSTDLLADTNDLEATIYANDILYTLMQEDTPLMPGIEDTTVSELFEILFKSLGLDESDYIIDLRYNYPINLGWYIGETVGSTFETLAEAGSCNVIATRDGKIKVESKFTKMASQVTLDGDSQIISLDIPQRYLETYNTVAAKYTIPSVSTDKALVLEIKNFRVPRGINTYNNIKFNDGPIDAVESIVLDGSVSSNIINHEVGSNGLNLVIKNENETEKVDLKVYGYKINSVETKLVVGDRSDDKKLKLENHLIQNEEAARNFSNLLINLYRSPSNTIHIDLRGNPAIEINDVITVNSNENNIYALDVLPFRNVFEYDGTFEMKIEATSLENIIVKDWVYIGHGLYVYVERE